ncbi:MAG: hypothetical protein JOZ10_18655 [Acidobacteria bacterium]|nr:hypothetical protein [Acidobacteriota bacterium]
MKRIALWLIAYCLLPLALFAQNWTTVSASNITDLNQVKLAAGNLCFLGTDSTDTPINFQVGGGGQVLARPFCVTVANGTSGSLTVPNPANTNPQGIYYRITVTDSSTGQRVLYYKAATFSGTTFNFDSYAPTLSNVGAGFGTGITVASISDTGSLSTPGPNLLGGITQIGASDTGISRTGATDFAFGNGTASDTTGLLQATFYQGLSSGVVKSQLGTNLAFWSGGLFCWTPNASITGACDTQETRPSAGAVSFDTATANNAAATVMAGSYQIGSGAGTTWKINSSGIAQYYNSFPTADLGLTPEVYSDHPTGLGASNGLTLTASASAGFYRACADVRVTTAGTAGTASLAISYNNGTANLTYTASTLALTSTGSPVDFCTPLHLGAGTTLSYQVTVSGATGSPVYAVDLDVERMH